LSEPAADRAIRKLNWLEPVADFIQNVVGGIYERLGAPGRLLKDLLHGTKPLGHPLHPALTDVPLGAWTAAVVADYAAYVSHAIPPSAGGLALAVGTLAALAAALAGYTDHHETFGHERRVATAHGLIMTTVILVMVLSQVLRLEGGGGARAAAVGLATVGLLLGLLGAYLGGHLTYAMGTMVNRNAFAEAPEDFVPVGTPKDFPDGVLKRVKAGAMAVLMVRTEGRLNAIAAVCSHAGGPLDEGDLQGDIVVCPWHGSRFCVRDGRVKGGPATFPLPSFLVRERAGKVEVKIDQPPH
jgi:nitrite reductase/ring-hydroxylating ferredoxin subunit/uncharacterized membrane protein